MSEPILAHKHQAHKHQTHNHAAHDWRIHCGVEVTELSTNEQHTLELLQLLVTSASPRAKSLIPIPVLVQYRLSRCLE
jgi:hypothetical protein